MSVQSRLVSFFQKQNGYEILVYCLKRCITIAKPARRHFKPCLQLFRETLSGTMCTWHSRKVKWDMTNALFLTLKLTNLLLLLSFSTRKHKSMASSAILSNFFEEQWKNHPQYLSGLSRAFSPTTFLEIAVYSYCWKKCARDNPER